MKNKFQILPKFLFVKSFVLFILFSYLAYRNLTFNSLVLMAVFSSLFVQQLIIVLSELKNGVRLIVWILSYFVSLSFLMNLDKEWFFLTWKYQVIIFLFILLNLFNLRFVSKRNKLLVIVSFINTLVFCLFLGYTVYSNFDEPFYFNITKALMIYTILFSIVLSLSRRKKGQKVVESKDKSVDSSVI